MRHSPKATTFGDLTLKEYSMSETPPTDPRLANARFTQISPGIIAEMMAHQTQIFYDPTTENVRVIFNGHQYVNTGERYIRIGEVSDHLHTNLNGMIHLRPATGLRDPVTQADLSNVSIAGMALIIKASYDLFFNQRANDLTAAQEHQDGLDSQQTEEDSPIQTPEID